MFSTINVSGRVGNLKKEDRGLYNEALAKFVESMQAINIGVRVVVDNKLNETNDAETILVVDNALIFLNIFQRHFDKTRYNLVCLSSGEMALKYLEYNSADLFLLDIEMPEMNGFDLATAIRAAGHNAPIIFITGKNTPDYVAKAIEVGASDFIAKPITKDQILERVRKYLP